MKKKLEKISEQRNHTYLRKKIALVWFLFTLCLIAGLTLVQRVSIDNGILAEKSVKNA